MVTGSGVGHDMGSPGNNRPDPTATFSDGWLPSTDPAINTGPAPVGPGTRPCQLAFLAKERRARTNSPVTVARRDRHGAGGGEEGARAPAVDGSTELGDGGGELLAGGRGHGVPAALPAGRVLLRRRRGRRARGHHQGAQGPHVPMARRLLPRRRPRPPPRCRRPALRQVQRLRRPHRRGPVRPRPRRLAPRRRRRYRPRQADVLRQGARPGALLLPAALHPDHELQMRRDGARVQLGAPDRRRGVRHHLLQPLGQDTRGPKPGRRRREPVERTATPRTCRHRRAALGQAGRARGGLLASPLRRRHGMLLLPRHRSRAQDAAAGGGPPPRRRRLRAHLGGPVADGGEDQGDQGGEDRDGCEDRRGRPERQLAGQRAEGGLRGGLGLVAREDRRVRPGGAAGRERGGRDGRDRGVPGGRGRLRRGQPDVRGHGAGGPVRAGAQRAEAGPRGVRHGRRRRGRRRARAAGRRGERPRRHGRAPQGRGRRPPRRARGHAPPAGCLIDLSVRMIDLCPSETSLDHLYYDATTLIFLVL